MKEATSQEARFKVITDQVQRNLTNKEVAKKEKKLVSGEHIEVTEVEVVNGDKYNLKSEMRKRLESHQLKILNFPINKEK
jgi:hypothetical protein